MIVGNGIIARMLEDKSEVIYFASGVSNFNENRVSEFKREFELLKKTIQKYPTKQLVYFSTIRVNDKVKNAYIKHKLNQEKYIKNHCKSYLILRLGNVFEVGGNPNNLINFLVNKIENQQEFQIWKNAKRYLTTFDDLRKVLNKKLPLNKTIGVHSNKLYTIQEIVKMVEEITGKKAKYKTV